MNNELNVIEFNQNEAEIVYSNGNYRGKSSSTLTMEDGDVLVVKQVTADSKRTDPDSILISEDLPISISYSYYDRDYDISGKATEAKNKVYNDGKPTFGYYSLYNQARILRLDQVSFHVKNGAEADSIQVVPLFAWTDASGQHHRSTGVFDDPFYYSGRTDPIPGQDNKTAVCTPGLYKKNIVYREGSLSIIGFNTDDERNEVSFIPGSTRFTVLSAGQRDLLINTTGTTLRAGTKSRKAVALGITKDFTEVGLDPTVELADQLFRPNTRLVIRADDPGYDDLLFHKMPEDTCLNNIDFSVNNSYTYHDISNNSTPKVQIGARKFAIEYGILGDTFQLSDAHQSVFNTAAASAGKENVGYFQSGTENVDLRIHEVRASTGIVIHDMQPEEFWSDVMGLRDSVVVDLYTDNSGIQYFPLSSTDGKIPQESAELTLFSSDNNRLITDPPTNNPLYIDTTETPTSAVVGQNPTNNLNGGYMLVEVDGFGFSNNYYDSKQRINVASILNLQYQNDNIITGEQSSSIPYQHRGDPLTLSTATIRFIDSITKKVSTNLGPNNTVILELQKAPKNLPWNQQQPDPAKKK